MSRRGRKKYIRRPDVVKRIGSYLGTSFPLFHVANFFTFCLRHCVPEFQKKMDAASGDEQLLLKKKLLNSLERYFYLVCFGAYCRLEGNVKTLCV